MCFSMRAFSCTDKDICLCILTCSYIERHRTTRLRHFAMQTMVDCEMDILRVRRAFCGFMNQQFRLVHARGSKSMMYAQRHDDVCMKLQTLMITRYFFMCQTVGPCTYWDACLLPCLQ